ncbi:MAG: cardiolipin synthase [Opitutae bacterium]|nr:cardiolipin synthase [Opitutae bacterium]
MKIFFLLCYFASWSFIPHLLLLKKRPAATLAWLWAIVFIPLLGAFAYLAIGTDRLKRRRLKRRNHFSARASRQRRPDSATDAATAVLVQALPPRARQFLQLLSRINQLPVSSAATLRVLCNAEEFYPALAQRIRAATHHLHLEFYIWQGDATGARFLRLLTEAAQRGVIVRLLLDGVGSHAFAESHLAEFGAAGGHFSWFQSLDPRRGRFFMNLRNHCKLQIVDGAVAFVGGMNIGLEHEGRDPALGHWRDVQVEVTGSVAAELQEVFADDWYFATGEKITAPEFFPPHPGTPRDPAHIVLGGPDRPNEPVTKSVVSLLNDASERVWIATGYFVPDDTVLTALELAASRGVDVRLLVSEKGDHPLLVTAGRSYYAQLLAAGVRIFEYSAGIHHAKIALADDQWAMVGSANLDYRSLRLNFELNLLFHSPPQNAVLAGILTHDFGLCLEVDPATFAQRPRRQQFLEAALRPLSPLL